MAKIKICGMRRDEDIDFANSLHPDYIGFVLTEGYRRSITPETAARLKKRLGGGIKAVGVFVNDGADKINLLFERNVIDIAQLHGDESPEYCKMIKAPIIKYFNCSHGEPHDLDKYDVDYFLFDSGTGTGRAFDWSNIPKTDKPFFLAGGISESNVKQAIDTAKPFAVDVSSSVETNGYKDYKKMKRFMEMARYE